MKSQTTPPIIPLLEIKDLQTWFHTEDGIVKGCDKVNYSVNKGETLAVVGESGSGKSVTAMSILGLIPNPPGEITGGDLDTIRGVLAAHEGSEAVSRFGLGSGDRAMVWGFLSVPTLGLRTQGILDALEEAMGVDPQSLTEEELRSRAYDLKLRQDVAQLIGSRLVTQADGRSQKHPVAQGQVDELKL